MKITVELDLSLPQLEGLQMMAARYPHGWSTADLIIRKDAKETRWEADWVKDVLRTIAAGAAP